MPWPWGKKVDYVQTETRIALIGKTGSGKSSTGNTLLDEEWFKAKLCNTSITKKTSSKHGKNDDQHILVIDTPGLFDTSVSNNVMRKEIMKCVALAAPGLHAVVLVTKIGRFTDEEKQTVEEYKKYFGEDLCRYLIIIFTGKDNLVAEKMSLEEYLQHADPLLQEVLRECNHRCLAVNNRGTKSEMTEFRKQFFSLLEDTVRRGGGQCYTSRMLDEAEVQMKLAERRKLTELEHQRGRDFYAEHNKKEEEIQKKLREENEKYAKEQLAVEEKNRNDQQRLENERKRIQTENEKRKKKLEQMKEAEEQKRIEYDAKLQRKARKLARKDVEEDESTLNNFMTKIKQKFKHLG